jgi:hypothetical protein
LAFGTGYARIGSAFVGYGSGTPRRNATGYRTGRGARQGADESTRFGSATGSSSTIGLRTEESIAWSIYFAGETTQSADTSGSIGSTMTGPDAFASMATKSAIESTGFRSRSEYPTDLLRAKTFLLSARLSLQR